MNLDEIKELCEKQSHITQRERTSENLAKFMDLGLTIANKTPALITALEEAWEERDRYKAALKEIEWSDENALADNFCPCCGRLQEMGHLELCPIGHALKEKP